jgi:hypothetical protein
MWASDWTSLHRSLAVGLPQHQSAGRRRLLPAADSIQKPSLVSVPQIQTNLYDLYNTNQGRKGKGGASRLVTAAELSQS